MNTKKRIKVLSSGIIRVKGFMYGPILTPYFEDIDTIYAMITSGVKVVEVADDGKEIELTISNIGSDNTSTTKKSTTETKKHTDPVKQEKGAEPVAEVKKEAEKEPEVVQEHRKPAEENKYQKYQKYNKYNNNRQNNSVKPTEHATDVKPEVKVEEAPVETAETVADAVEE